MHAPHRLTRLLPLALGWLVLPQQALADAAQQAAQPGVEDRINEVFATYIVAPLLKVLFFDVAFWDDSLTLPAIVAWLVFGASFFTLRMGFINARAFGHAIAVTSGHYDRPGEPGEVSHFQALASALSATVGLGNIAGVAIAVHNGGPGAVFWMVVAGLLGMSSKFVECSLGQLYRDVDSQGRVHGGPMRYLAVGLRELGRPILGKALALCFAVLCIGGSFGGGNMFQANQSYAQVSAVVPLFADSPALYGFLMATLVGVVIFGGIRRIATVAGYLVPMMCGVYLLASLVILVAHADKLGAAIGVIVSEAFTPRAGLGGVLGVLVTGFQRAAFSNEAGIGSASIAHSAAATHEPIREGIVALLEPFIDTVVVCTMTGLVVVVTGAYLNDDTGVALTSTAFASVLPWFPKVLAVTVVLFAYSTMISWSYYGERCWAELFGPTRVGIYRGLFLVFTFLGPILHLGAVLDFSDLMILGMALPNIAGAILLSGTVRARLDDYLGRLHSGQMPRAR